jgi:hypothetical protein
LHVCCWKEIQLDRYLPPDSCLFSWTFWKYI